MIGAPAVANMYECTGRNFSGSGFGTTSRLRESEPMAIAPVSSQQPLRRVEPDAGLVGDVVVHVGPHGHAAGVDEHEVVRLHLVRPARCAARCRSSGVISWQGFEAVDPVQAGDVEHDGCAR